MTTIIQEKLVAIQADYQRVSKAFSALLTEIEQTIPNFDYWMFMDDSFEPLWQTEKGELFHWYYFEKGNHQADNKSFIVKLEENTT